MKPLAFVALLPVIVWTWSCDSSPPPSAAVAARDSAGIAILEFPRLPELDSSLRVEAKPEVVIGVAEGDEAYQLQRVVGALRLSDGRIAIADGGASQIRYFDRTGAHLQSVGRDGDGPGEFRFLSTILRLPGDSIVAASLNSSITLMLFAPDGGFVRGLEHPQGRQPRGMLRDGRALYLSYAGTVDPRTTGFVQDEIVVWARAEGGAADTLIRLPGNQEFRQEFMNGIANGSVPFGREVQVAVQGDRVFVGVGSEGEVRVFEDGGLRRILRFTGARETLTSAEIDEWKTYRTSFARNPAQARLAADFVAAQTFPQTRPVFLLVLAGTDGSLWLSRFGWRRNDPGEQRWYLVDPERGTLATVHTPAGLRVIEVGADYVLGVATDDLGVESVRLHKLARNEP